MQKRELGGEIVKVNSAFSTNAVCSETCGKNINHFIGDSSRQVSDGSYGMINGKELNNRWLDEQGGIPKNVVEIVNRGFATEGFGIEGGGGGGEGEEP